MVEVRPSIRSGGLGLFVTKDHSVGDILLHEEKPLIRLAPQNDKELQLLLSALPPIRKQSSIRNNEEDNEKDDNNDCIEFHPSSFTRCIQPPSSIQPEYIGKFCSMVQAVTCFAEFDRDLDQTSKFLQLYAPTVDGISDSSQDIPREDATIIQRLSTQCLQYVQNHSKGGSKLRSFVTSQPDVARKVMLLWSCNSFEGGRIYDTCSRINHSCFPNSVVSISHGDNHNNHEDSKDGLIIRAATNLVAGTEVTISYLGLWLYTDYPTRQSILTVRKHFVCHCERCCVGDDNPDYAAAIPCRTAHPRQQGRYLEEEVAYDDDKSVTYVYPRGTHRRYESKKEHSSTSSNSHDDGLTEILESVSQKVRTYIQDKETRDSEEDESDEEWEFQLHRLTCSVAGAMHWTTNLINLMRLNRLLKTQHAQMLELGENPPLEEVAESIDMLERLCHYVEGLHLNLDVGHILGGVMVGVARTLVSLGDSKSKQYAAKWLHAVADYTEKFESEGMKKVVASLLQSTEDCDPKGKKPRTS